jgi:hypothetical protein
MVVFYYNLKTLEELPHFGSDLLYICIVLYKIHLLCCALAMSNVKGLALN